MRLTITILFLAALYIFLSPYKYGVNRVKSFANNGFAEVSHENLKTKLKETIGGINQPKGSAQLKKTNCINYSSLINTTFISIGSKVEIRGFSGELFISFFDCKVLTNRCNKEDNSRLSFFLQIALKLIYPYHSYW